LGGCQLSVMTGEQVLNVPIPWPMALIPLVIIPDFTLSTAKARAVLPSLTPRGDAIFNTTRLGLLVLALMQNRPEWLAHALQDRLHQPYRLPLVPGMSDVAEAGITAGAYGVVLSGAGPTLLALCSEQTTAAVAEMMQSTWDALGIRAHTRVLSVDIQGAVLL
jgi:homoserine kinase